MTRYLLTCILIILTCPAGLLAGQVMSPLQPDVQKSITPAAGNIEEELIDIKGPIDLPAEHETTLLLAAAILGILLLIGLFIFLRKKSTKQKAILAHESALNSLHPGEALIADHNVDEFTNLIDQTLRKYIEQRFTISARRQTTREFVDNISCESNNLPDILTHRSAQLQTLLSQLDMVKFARADMTTDSMKHILAGLISFIEATKMEVS